MSYLIDTNVLSELRRKSPDANVMAWIAQRQVSTLYLSVLTLGELRKGIAGLADPQRQLALQDWLEVELANFFAGRILPINSRVADHWGRICAGAGRPVPAIDSLLAATAACHGLSMVTRNIRDYAGLGVEIINPWQAGV